VHQTRLEAVLQAVEAITRVQRLTLTEIGRAVRAGCLPRHGIKKIDRLLSNPRLLKERHILFGALVRQLIGPAKRIVVLLDWTQIHGELWALVASIPFLGRSIPILAHAHRKSSVGSRAAQDDFLRVLRKIFPASCRPIIVADAGFRSPFFRSCRTMGFVIRLRSDKAVASVGEHERIAFDKLFKKATTKAQCLGDGIPYASSQHRGLYRLVVGAAPKKAKRREKYVDDYERKRACEPYLLVTNLENESAESIVAIYEKRMQVEETFRDAKSPRLGWGLAFTKTSSVARLNVMLLLVSLAFFVVMLIGAAAEQLKLDRQLRASSVKRRVLSIFSVGSIILRLRNFSIALRLVWKQLLRVREIHRALFPKITPPRSQNRAVKLPLPHGLFCADCGWRGAELGWPA
jgi:hypothetical protein